MNRFEQTLLWQTTLAQQTDTDNFQKERSLLRVEFENFRDRAKTLASEIALSLPEYTVHDISHIDALWDNAELITKGDYELTPAEVYVLGGAFLIHDLGMGLASFPNGVSELKKETIWKDTVASLLKNKLNREIKKSDYINLDKTIEKIATENVLRLLHAKHAEKLALISWEGKKKEELFLIENSELRNAYGNIIGLIAHSHWWPVDELESKLPKILGAPGFLPSTWIVDPIKLSCILRISDATQIDDRRAPSFLRAIRKLSTNSDNHWNFQEKLYQPRLERNRLVYTSKSPFTIDEVESWWICYDTLQMIDEELKNVDALLVDTNRPRFKANGVLSVEDPKRLSKLITVDRWHPVDTKIKVTSVAKLVGSLGGEQLYGKNLKVPLRELIQNAADAIRARRVIENETGEFGNITIRLGKDNHGQYIEIEDNGIGMSQKVLTGPFLDFGQSFWGTALMHEELPGLESKGFKATGKYGIGFFSVFMWGEKVTVTSKRFENGWDTTLVLEFNKGSLSRPILKIANSQEIIKDGGTRVRVWLSSNKILDLLLERNGRDRKNIDFSELLENLCPSVDCNIILEEGGSSKIIIKSNDWITLTPIDFLKRVIGKSIFNDLEADKIKLLDSLSGNVSLLYESDGKVVGRALLYRSSFFNSQFEGIVTIGGMSSSGLTGILGILLGTSDRASRDIGIPIVSLKIISQWASFQASLLSKLSFDLETQMACGTLVRLLGGDTLNLKIIGNINGPLSIREFKDNIAKMGYDSFIILSYIHVKNLQKDYPKPISFLINAFWTESAIPGCLQTRNRDHHIDWPRKYKLSDWFHSYTLYGSTLDATAEVWEYPLDEILSCSDISSDEISYNATIGYIDDNPITDNHIDTIKKPSL